MISNLRVHPETFLSSFCGFSAEFAREWHSPRGEEGINGPLGINSRVSIINYLHLAMCLYEQAVYLGSLLHSLFNQTANITGML